VTGRARRGWALLAVALLPACGFGAQGIDHPVDDDDVPYDLLAPSTTTTTSAPPPATTTTLAWRTNLWFVRGDHLEPVTRQLRIQPAVPLVLTQLLRGPAAADPASVRTALEPDDASAADEPTGGALTVDLGADFGTRPSSEQILALGQLVFTVTEVPGVGRVIFRIDGAELDVPLPNGQLAAGSVSRDDYASLVFPSG
jgi:spore germination protein GerM